jgi:DNA repair protein RecO (recombination protein O)
MKEETFEGIVLRSVPVQEGKRILAAFTPGEGLVSVATPKTFTHEMRLASATALLSRSEFCCRKGNSDIYRLREACLLESFDGLRASYSKLSAAGDLLHAILRSQLAGRPAPLLYELLLTYLRRLNSTQHPLLLVISFKLKLLKHEGLFAWTRDIPPPVQELASFSIEDWLHLGLLVGSRSFAEIESVAASPDLAEKVASLFEKLIR